MRSVHQYTVHWLTSPMRKRQTAGDSSRVLRFSEYNAVAVVCLQTPTVRMASSDCFISNRLQQNRAQLLALLGRHPLDVDRVLRPNYVLDRA